MLEHLFGERDRAVSFGSVAERYDRYRSGYPDDMIDDLVAAGPQTALDVGCGTGKLATALLMRGVDVVGVDPDEQMAAIATQRGVAVEIASFEQWDEQGRQHDLITSGHAWHWVEPTTGMEKATRLLRPGGSIARCWSYDAVEPALLSRFEDAYCRCAPGLQVIGRDPSGLPDVVDRFAALPEFVEVRQRRYRWSRLMSAEQWIGMISTFGDHIWLTADVFSKLAHTLEQAIAEVAGR